MKIFLGADHGGFYLKEKVQAYLTKRGVEWEDMGDKSHDKDFLLWCDITQPVVYSIYDPTLTKNRYRV